MGLISAALGAAGGVMADQWKEYFYCEALPETVIMTKGHKRESGRGSNNGSDNIISNGSVIAVADGQCMIIVDQGKVTEICAEPGEFTYDSSSEPSLFTGNLGEAIKQTFANIGKRFTFGGEAPKDQRVYYFNTKELIGNKYGTPNPVPFRVVDERAGIDMDISMKCFGEYSYRVCDPILFYTNVCGNAAQDYKREQLDSMLKTELLTALQPAFAKISEMGIRYSSIPGHTTELADALNEVLSKKWRELRGIEIVSFGVSSIKADEEDEKTLKELQKAAAYTNPNLAAAAMVNATSNAMQTAAGNSGGAAIGFMGMNMAQQAGGINAQNLYAMGAQQQQQQAAPAAPAAAGWDCACGQKGITGNFCPECGAKRPETSGWTCSCGTVNQGKFCTSCGAKKPAGAPQYKCDKCGWMPEDPSNPPKFCPECGDPFGDEDLV
ncbi:Membrane protease subunit, stomatin/prohibitin family, contains C-terminal Zn-ribbon domain [Lachnospiraceae bacterium XBB2008]|nr:Membrane protease subunit, stomatin/prohibitin family, contains C-terminal Zn-ribbon domain [Lachnospiraceae bacterium XBB2008]